MPAYLIGHISIKNPARWKDYVDGVQKSLMPFNGKVLFRGKRTSVLTGTHPHEHVVVISFPDQPTLQRWYNSTEYQGLIPIRDEAADVAIISYDA